MITGHPLVTAIVARQFRYAETPEDVEDTPGRLRLLLATAAVR